MKKLPLLCLLALAPAFVPAVSWANIIPTGTTISGVGPYVWSYDLQLSSDQDAHSGAPPVDLTVPHDNDAVGSFLTLYDFDGYVAGTCAGPAGWVCSTQSVGYTPDDVAPVDDPAITNLTWVYTTGPLLTGQPNGIDLGRFSAQSIYNTRILVSYTSRGVKNSGFANGTIADNVGNTSGPVSPLTVPEPGSLALAGLALAIAVTGGSLPKKLKR